MQCSDFYLIYIVRKQTVHVMYIYMYMSSVRVERACNVHVMYMYNNVHT